MRERTIRGNNSRQPCSILKLLAEFLLENLYVNLHIIYHYHIASQSTYESWIDYNMLDEKFNCAEFELELYYTIDVISLSS